MDHEKELGRYKKKVADQAKEIAELKAKEASYLQIYEINLAMITAIVHEVGTVTIHQDDINAALERKLVAQDTWNAEKRTHTLSIVK